MSQKRDQCVHFYFLTLFDHLCELLLPSKYSFHLNCWKRKVIVTFHVANDGKSNESLILNKKRLELDKLFLKVAYNDTKPTQKIYENIF